MTLLTDLFIQAGLSSVRLKLKLNDPPGRGDLGQGEQRGVHRSIGQVVARFACIL